MLRSVRVDDGPLRAGSAWGTWVLDVVPMMQQLLGCVECVSWQVLLGDDTDTDTDTDTETAKES